MATIPYEEWLNLLAERDALVEALERFVEWYEQVNLQNEPCFQFYDRTKKALAARRKGGDV